MAAGELFISEGFSVRTEARHRLKEDPFAEGTREIFDWVVDHRVNLVGGIVVAAVIVAAYLFWWNHQQNRNEQAGLELNQAVRTMNAPIAAEAIAGQESYPTVSARAQAAEKKFADIAEHYGSTDSGHMAAYYLGVTRMNSGDNSGAEQQFKMVADSSDKNTASLAKMALASLYVSTGRDQQAISLSQELVAHPTDTVTKPQAQLQLAEAYQQKQPQEAVKIYQQLATGEPGSPLASIATDHLATLLKK